MTDHTGMSQALAMFEPHGHCFLWKPDLIALHVVSDLATGLSYYAIPLAMFYFMKKKKDLPFRSVFLLFALFIISCGTTHLMSVWTIWVPDYWLEGYVKAATALVSITTAAIFFPMIPHALKIPSPAQLTAVNKSLEEEIEVRREAEAALQKHRDTLEEVVAARTEELTATNIQLNSEIQERMRAEQAERESGERYRALFAAVSDPVLVADTGTGVLVECNEAAERYFGRTREQLIGLPQRELHPPDIAKVDGLTEDFQHSVAAPSVRTVVPLLAAGGEIRVSEVQTSLFDFNGRKLILGVFRDITEQRRAEEALRLANFRSDQALSLTRAGYWYVPLDGSGWYESSERAAKLFGDPPREDWRYRIMEEWFANVEAGDKAAAEKTLENFTAATEGRIPEYDSIYAYKRPIDGRIVWIHALGHVVKDASGKPTDLYGVTQDITESKLAGDALRQAKEMAEAANHAKSEFLANMSHEIRTPLNGVLGMLQLISTSDVSGKVETYAEMAIRAGHRLTSLLGDILDLSRIEAGRMPIVKQPFALADIINALAETFSPMHYSKRLSFAISVGPDVPTHLVGDEVRVRQVLFNLVGNAIKFTDAGEIRAEVSLLLPLPPNKVRLLFVVSDTGIGMPEGKIDSICEPFTQVDESYTRAHQGAGLGLSISKHLIKAMGGTLTFDSVEGEGTTVYLMLPFEALDHLDMPKQLHAKKQVGPASPLRILLVEDEEISQLSVLLVLQKMGHTVHTANHGGEALAAMREHQFDCVLMDVQMDIMDGVEATRQIRMDDSGAFDPHIPIIAMTAYAMRGDREKFIEAGMTDYIAKPIKTKELVEALARVAGSRN